MQKNLKSTSQNLKINFLRSGFQVLIVVIVLFLLSNTFLKNDKIAYVESARILNEYKGSAEARKAYQAKAQVWQANIDTLTSEVKGAIRNYEKSIVSMSKKEQELSRQLIQAKQRQLAAFQQGVQENAKTEDGKLMQTVVSQVNAYLANYGKEHHYKLILIANQSGTIAYGEDGLDITSDVVEGLNAAYLTGKK